MHSSFTEFEDEFLEGGGGEVVRAGGLLEHHLHILALQRRIHRLEQRLLLLLPRLGDEFAYLCADFPEDEIAGPRAETDFGGGVYLGEELLHHYLHALQVLLCLPIHAANLEDLF